MFLIQNMGKCQKRRENICYNVTTHPQSEAIKMLQIPHTCTWLSPGFRGLRGYVVVWAQKAVGGIGSRAYVSPALDLYGLIV